MNPNFPHMVTIDYPYPEVEQWCLTNIGGWNKQWIRTPADLAALAVLGDGDETYCFRTSEQATLFALRWA